MPYKLILLGAGREQGIAISKAHNLGMRVIALDGNPEATSRDLADEFIVADIKNPEAILSALPGQSYDGIYCHGVELSESLAVVAEALGLIGISPQVARTATDKWLRREALARAQIAIPRAVRVRDISQATSLTEELSFPMVVKPSDNSGARGVVKVDDPSYLKEALLIAQRYSHSGILVVEEFLSGPQLSVESIVVQGRTKVIGIANRNYQKNNIFYPYFVEDGVDLPANIPEKMRAQIEEIIQRAAEALGVKVGPFKADLIIAKDEVVGLEFATRSSGGWFSAGTIPLSTGIDLVSLYLKQCVGLELSESDTQPKRSAPICQRYWIPEKSGRLESVMGIDTAAIMPGVEMLDAFFPPIGSMVRKSTNHSERYAQVICSGATVSEAARRAESVIKHLEVSLG